MSSILTGSTIYRILDHASWNGNAARALSVGVEESHTMDFYDETTRQVVAAVLALLSIGLVTFTTVKLRGKGRERRKRLRRDWR